MVTEKDKKTMASANLERNKHVLDIMMVARGQVANLVQQQWCKADIFLLANQMKDIAERFD